MRYGAAPLLVGGRRDGQVYLQASFLTELKKNQKEGRDCSGTKWVDIAGRIDMSPSSFSILQSPFYLN